MEPGKRKPPKPPYKLSLLKLSEHDNKGNMYCQLTTDFLYLDRNRNVIILLFFPVTPIVKNGNTL